MSRSRGNFGGYRGRRTLTDILKIIAAVLAVAVVVVFAALFLLQDYIVYTDSGIRLELPSGLGAAKSSSEQSSPDPSNVTVVEKPDRSGPETSQAQPAEETLLRAVQVSVPSLLDGSAVSLVEKAGGDALILDMKSPDGQLAWHSGQPLADEADVNGDNRVNETIVELKEEGLYTIARVCCFRDDSVPYYDTEMALRTSGGNWRDELGLRWMSPANEKAQIYLAGLCGELAAMGFDEIVLEQFSFPVQGNLSRIVSGESYDPTRFTEQIQAFLTLVQQAIEPYGTTLSLRIEQSTLTQEERSGGLTVQLVNDFAARIWLEKNEDADGTNLSQFGEAGRVVNIVDELQADMQVHQAVLTTKDIP